jgi:hypothetical protein
VIGGTVTPQPTATFVDIVLGATPTPRTPIRDLPKTGDGSSPRDEVAWLLLVVAASAAVVSGAVLHSARRRDRGA